MSKEYVKRDLGQPIMDVLTKEPMRLVAMLHQDTVTAVVSLLVENLSAEHREPVLKVVNEKVKKPLTMSEVIVTALLSPYEDEKTLEGSEQIARFDLARRCNKLGMVKLNSADISKINTLVKKKYQGSMIAPTVQYLLEGKKVELTLDDEDDSSEEQSTSTAAPPPA